MGSIPTVSTTWISRNLPLDSFTKKYGGVAQLVRVFGSHPKGRGFESLRLHHCCTVRFDGLFFSAHFWFALAPLVRGCFCETLFCRAGWGKRGETALSEDRERPSLRCSAVGPGERHSLMGGSCHSCGREGAALSDDRLEPPSLFAASGLRLLQLPNCRHTALLRILAGRSSARSGEERPGLRCPAVAFLD